MNIRRCVRFIPAVMVMALIFLFSAMPGDELMHTANPLIQHMPQTLHVPVKLSVARGGRIAINYLKVGHFIGYFGLGAALLFGLQPQDRLQRAGSRWMALFALAITALYAFTDEYHQTFVRGRTARLSDVVIDVSAAALAILLFELGRWVLSRKG